MSLVWSLPLQSVKPRGGPPLVTDTEGHSLQGLPHGSEQGPTGTLRGGVPDSHGTRVKLSQRREDESTSRICQIKEQ